MNLIKLLHINTNEFTRLIILKFLRSLEVLKSIVYFTSLGNLWLIYFILMPIIVPIFFFTQIVENNVTEIPYIIFYLAGFLSFSISFAGFRFVIRSFFSIRKNYFKIIYSPLENFDKYFSLNIIFFVVNLLILIGALYYYNLNIIFYSYFDLFVSIFCGYYFGQFISLIFAFGNIVFRDSKFIGRNIATLFFLFSPIAYSLPAEKGSILYDIYIFNPISQCAYGFRNAVYGSVELELNLNLIYAITFFLLCRFLRNKISKIIYKYYSICL